MPRLGNYPCTHRDPSGRRCPILLPKPGRCELHADRFAEAAKRFRKPKPGDYGREWPKIAKAYRAAHPICEYPGCTKPSLDVDHVLAKRDGGTDHGPLMALCRGHHVSKTMRDARRRSSQAG